jgi:hypothetical protein
MSMLITIPKGFRILSESPVLRIKYRMQLNGCFFIPWSIAMIFAFLLVFMALVSILEKLVHSDLEQVIQNLHENAIFYCIVLLFNIAFGAVVFYIFWIVFGITDFQASCESLTVVNQLFGINLHIKIFSRNEIRYFKLIEFDSDGFYSFPRWGLKLVTNEEMIDRYKFIDLILEPQYKSFVMLGVENIGEVNWLGKILARFYQLNYYTTKLNN